MVRKSKDSTLSRLFNKLSPTAKLKTEVELLTTCSSDTIYRLRYDAMQYDYISPAVLDLLGYNPDELMKINMRSLIIETRIVNDGMKPVESYDSLEENRKRGQVQKWQADYLMKTKDGRKIWVSDISHPWFDEKGAIIGSKGSLRDITDRIRAEEKARTDPRHRDFADELTGLANLRSFWLRLEEEVRRTHRTKDPITVMLLHVNKLAEIRTLHGDTMVKSVVSDIAKMMQKNLRSIDIIAHISEENFGLVMPETTPEEAIYAAKRIIKIIESHSFLAGNQEGDIEKCTVSVGISGSHKNQRSDANFLYKLADTRLLAAMQDSDEHIVADEFEESV